METREIKYDLELTKKLYNRYFKYERKLLFQKIPIKTLFGLSILLIVIGIGLGIYMYWILGLILTTITAIFLLYYYFRFNMVINKFSKDLEKKAKSGDSDFQFSFDSEFIYYTGKNMNTEIKWDMIKSYNVNENDIYLFFGNRELMDITSEEILGPV